MALNSHTGFVKLQADFYGKDKEKDDFALALEPLELLSAGSEKYTCPLLCLVVYLDSTASTFIKGRQQE